MNTENQTPRPAKPEDVSQLLPSDARKLLIDASRVNDPVMRAKCVDQAATVVRQRYPSMFKAE